MKRKLFLGLVVVIFMFSMIVVQPVVADVVFLDVAIQINPGMIIVITFDVIEETQFYGELRTIEGLAGLLVLDSSNYIKWNSSESWSSIFLSSIDLEGITFNFTISKTDIWRFCFIAQPDPATSSAIVTGCIWRRVADTTTTTTTETTSETTTEDIATTQGPPTTTSTRDGNGGKDLSVIAILGIIGVVGIIVIGVVVSKRGKKNRNNFKRC